MIDAAIRGGTVAGPDLRPECDIGIEGGVIHSIGDVPSAREEIDATGLLVLPGGVDAHTHLETQVRSDAPRSPSDYYKGTVAAACGGITTIVDYARQYPGRSLFEAVEERNAKAAGKAVIDYGFHLTPTGSAAELEPQLADMVAAGFPSYKIFMNWTGETEVLRTMRALARHDAVANLHCQSRAIEEDAHERLASMGRATPRYWAELHPVASEVEATSRALDYASYTGCTPYIVHVSSAGALDRIRRARAGGADVWTETRPCYLLFTLDRYELPDPAHLAYTGYPPLRTTADVEALWEAAADGTVDVLASDHAAWTLAQKAAAKNVTALPVGLPSLETQSRAVYTRGVAAGRLSVEKFVSLTATGPALAMGIYPRKGVIAVGSDADLVLWDTRRRATIRLVDMHAGVDNEPCEGMECIAPPVRTISRGETIVRDGRFVGDSGRGRLLRRARPPRDRSAPETRPVLG
jgi:dihydropyrimidinase